MIAVVQLAVEQCAWVIDALGGEGARQALGMLLRWMLEGDSVATLGFAFAGDLAAMRPLYGGAEVRATSLIDLQVLGRLAGEDTPSLKKVCARTIARTLDKTEQCSDWAARPLRTEQMRYAALDASMCLRVLHAMEADSGERGLLPLSADGGEQQSVL